MKQLLLIIGLLAGMVQAAEYDELLKSPYSRLDGPDSAVKQRALQTPGRALAFVILGRDCPISRRMLPRMMELAQEAEERGVDFYGVISDDSTDMAQLRDYLKEYAVEFPVFFDGDTEIAKSLKSAVKPESFVFSKDGKLLYRGRIDNRFASIGRLRNHFDQHDLLNAIVAAAEEREPDVASAAPVGCVYHRWSDETSGTGKK
jgi:thiol-disulfide isomerase/thioredoxin